MRVVSISTVFVLIVFNVSFGLPPSRRYEYDYVDSGNRKPIGLGTRFGPRYGDVPRGLGEHTKWCPLRARDALRLPETQRLPAAQRLPETQRLSAAQRLPETQRLPAASRMQRPNYFRNPSEDNGAVRRYGRSERTDSDVHQANDFNEADNPDWDNDGVDVGGIYWPRRQIPKLEVEKPDCGCHHDKIASLAKDATAAAANAATAAAVAARAAARAAAAAVCGTEERPDDHVHDYQEQRATTSFNPDARSGYPITISQDYQAEEDIFQDERNFHGANPEDADNIQQFSEGINDSTENLVDDGLSQGTTKSEIATLISRTRRPISQSVIESKEFSQGMNSGREFSHKETAKSESNPRSSGSVMNSQGVIDRKESTGSREFSQRISPNEEASRKNTGAGVNYKGLTYNGNHSQGTSGANVRSNAGASTLTATGKAMYSPGTTDNRVYSQGSNTNGVSSQGSTGSRGVNSQRSNSTWTNPTDDKVLAAEDDLSNEIKKNFTSSGLSNVQSIPHT